MSCSNELIPHRMYFVNDVLYILSEQYAVELKLKGYNVDDLYGPLNMEPELYAEDYVFCYDTKSEGFQE